MINDTMRKFGYPATLVKDYRHWVVLVRPQQVTLGSLVLIAKGDAEAFGALNPLAHAELAQITAEIEAALARVTNYDRINYLMLMMVDRQVHFHIIPRYAEAVLYESESFADAGWPGPPDLKSARTAPVDQLDRLRQLIASHW